MPSPYSLVLTGLELMFMGLTGPNSGLLALQVLLSHLWEKEKKEKKRRREGRKNGIKKEWKEGIRNKIDWRKVKKKGCNKN